MRVDKYARLQKSKTMTNTVQNSLGESTQRYCMLKIYAKSIIWQTQAQQAIEMGVQKTPFYISAQGG